MKTLRAWLYFEWQIYKEYIKPYLRPSMFISFGIAWFITNGWSYLLIAIGSGWLRGIAIGYATMLWFPLSIEKPITIAIAIWIQKILFVKKEVASYERNFKTTKRKSVEQSVK